ncbi:MAG: Zn-ribbon domain-containing OB-fold protein [Microbacteriaceae bacterium]
MLSWEPVTGRARVVTWTIVAGDGDGDLLSGIVELDEGPWMTGMLTMPPQHVRAGMGLVVRFVRVAGGELVPAFAPMAS